VRNSY